VKAGKRSFPSRFSSKMARVISRSVSLRVGQEHLDDRGRVDSCLEREHEVEEVASLLALVERPELRPKELFDPVRGDLGSAVPPAGGDRERHLHRSAHGEVLARVGLDLELESNDGGISDSKR